MLAGGVTLSQCSLEGVVNLSGICTRYSCLLCIPIIILQIGCIFWGKVKPKSSTRHVFVSLIKQINAKISRSDHVRHSVVELSEKETYPNSLKSCLGRFGLVYIINNSLSSKRTSKTER